MSRDWTASDGGTRGGPLCAVQRPITADGTLPTEQLVRQLASRKCNDCQMWAAPVRTAINTNTSKKYLKKDCASTSCYQLTQPSVRTFGNFMSISLREWPWYLLFSLSLYTYLCITYDPYLLLFVPLYGFIVWSRNSHITDFNSCKQEYVLIQEVKFLGPLYTSFFLNYSQQTILGKGRKCKTPPGSRDSKVWNCRKTRCSIQTSKKKHFLHAQLPSPTAAFTHCLLRQVCVLKTAQELPSKKAASLDFIQAFLLLWTCTVCLK